MWKYRVSFSPCYHCFFGPWQTERKSACSLFPLFPVSQLPSWCHYKRVKELTPKHGCSDMIDAPVSLRYISGRSLARAPADTGGSKRPARVTTHRPNISGCCRFSSCHVRATFLRYPEFGCAKANPWGPDWVTVKPLLGDTQFHPTGRIYCPGLCLSVCG